MARRSTLGKILTDVRLEARRSSSAALNVQERDRQVQLIQREQQRLWEDYDWPHLRVERFIPLQIGQRFYDLATCQNEAGDVKGDLIYDRIEMIEVKEDDDWRLLRPEITRHDYLTYDSALDERSNPARAWRVYEDEQLEIWPISDIAAVPATQDSYLRITGIRNLNPLVQESDRADLDDTLLALFVAYLLETDQAAMQKKLDAANRHYARLKADQKKCPTFQMFGVGTQERKYPTGPLPYVSRYTPPE